MVDGVYVAVGYSMANVTLIVGDEGVVIVDTTSKIDDAQAGLVHGTILRHPSGARRAVVRCPGCSTSGPP